MLVKAETGQEHSLKWQQLHSTTWLELSSRDMSQIPGSCTLGIFLAFDRDADLTAARSKLDEAARSGQDVKIWMERVNRMVDRTTDQQVSQTRSERLPGYWLIRMGKRRMAFAMEFYENGQGDSFVDAWEKRDDGSYRVEIASRGTAKIIIIGDRLFGRFSNGTMFRGSR